VLPTMAADAYGTRHYSPTPRFIVCWRPVNGRAVAQISPCQAFSRGGHKLTGALIALNAWFMPLARAWRRAANNMLFSMYTGFNAHARAIYP